jgi:hypothetical protein
VSLLGIRKSVRILSALSTAFLLTTTFLVSAPRSNAETAEERQREHEERAAEQRREMLQANASGTAGMSINSARSARRA